MLGPLALTLLQDPTSNPQPEETIVVAPRSRPVAAAPRADLTVLTQSDLQRTGETSLPRMIARAAGAGTWLQSTSLSGGSPYLRGFIGEKVLIVVDGVRVNDATTPQGPNGSLNTIDPSCVERVEIVRGPGSVLYGSDAIGGAILIWTKNRAPRGTGATEGERALGGTLASSYDTATRGARGSVEVEGAGESDGWVAAGALYDWDKLRSGDGDVENTGYHGQSLFGSWSHALGRQKTLRFSVLQHRDFDVPRTDRLNQGFGQTQPASSEFYTLEARRTHLLVAFTDAESGAIADRMQARFFLRSVEESRQQRNTGSSTRRLEESEAIGYGAGVDWRKAIGSSQVLTWGLDVQKEEVDSRRDNLNVNTGVVTAATPPVAPGSRYLTTGVFVQDEILALKPLDLSVGLRYSRFDFDFQEFTSGPAGGPEVDGNFDALTGSVRAALPLGGGFRATSALSQGFRAPGLNDLASNGTAFGGTVLANPEVDPESSLTGEVGVEYQDPVWSASILGHHTGISDALGSRLVDTGDPGTLGDETYVRDNVGRLEIYGVELALQRKLGDATSDWSARLGAAWTKGKQFDDTIDPGTGDAPFNDVPARRIPPLFGTCALLYEPAEALGALGWSELRLNAAARQDDLNPDDQNDPRINPNGTPGWATVDVDVGGPLGGKESRSTWTLGLHNVFDRTYRVHASGIDGPGLGLVAGVSWSF